MRATLEQLARAPASVEVMLAWLRALGREGLATPNQVRLRRTAIKQLWQQRDADPGWEDNDEGGAAWLLENLDSLVERVEANGKSRSTAQTYRSRAARTVTEFLRYQARPEELRLDRRAARATRRERVEEILELPGGRIFRYQLPPEFTKDDLRRVHLMLQARVDPEVQDPLPFEDEEERRRHQ